MRIALCQMQIIWESKEKNRRTASKFIQDAVQNGVDLILFPEMTLTGFSMEIEMTSESDFETLTYFQRKARENALRIGFGWVKKVGERAENHYTILESDGEVINDYVKIHPFSFSGENVKFIAGEEIKNFEIDHTKMGNFICYDLRFPEVFQISSQEAHVIIVPANWPKSRQAHWKCLLQARAIENQVYILGINCVGYQKDLYYAGDSCVINPNGEIIQLISEEEMLLVYDFNDDVEIFRKSFLMKEDRKNKLYAEYLIK